MIGRFENLWIKVNSFTVVIQQTVSKYFRKKNLKNTIAFNAIYAIFNIVWTV